jgi:threonylcarbamoyladenosine tRNA methylthiotransferase MtaB
MNIVDFTDNPDIYIINTCTVTHVSDRKSRAMIRRAARSHSHALVAITGCMAQVASRELADIEGIDLIVGNLNKDSIADIIENVRSRAKKTINNRASYSTINRKTKTSIVLPPA